jgi:hypothetical protein
MARPRDTRRLRRSAALLGAAVTLAIIMTWPLARGMSTLGRSPGGGDGMFSVWNVAWVARTIVVDPLKLFDANIFYPHRTTLAYSEANIGAGVIALVPWWLTHDAYAAHNVVVLAAFATAFVGMWWLARYLTNDLGAASIAAFLFAFCPYLFAHSAHMQLLLCGGLPLSMLALHRVADAPSVSRGAILGVVLWAQALSCGYYGVFAGLMIAYATMFFALSRNLWRSVPYWRAVIIGALVSIVCVVPFLLPYISVQQQEGPLRALADAVPHSANAQSYLASATRAHYWMIEATAKWPRWTDVLFPGFLALALGFGGLACGLWTRPSSVRSRDRETALLYGSLGALACWASFGPAAGLYAWLFRLPVFALLRAPSRFGIVVVLALAALSSLALRRVFAWFPPGRRWIALAIIAAAAFGELNILPFPWERARTIPAPYVVLAKMPKAPLAEFPFYGERPVFHLHTQYMLFSTAHWMPMVNGYSDRFPDDFRQAAPILASFPSVDTFRLLAHYHVRYLAVHWDMYVARAEEIRQKLEPFKKYLRPISSDSTMNLYEIVAFP